MAAKLFLHALIVSLLLAAPPAAHSERQPIRATMTRSEKAINFTEAAHRSRARLSMLAARLDDAAAPGRLSAQAPLRLDGDGGAYDMEFSVGTPPQEFSALADTGSDLIWLKCGACAQCAPQGSPSYYPNRSSTFSKLPCSSGLCGDLESQSLASCSGGGGGGEECDYKYSYGLSSSSDHYTQGYLASETFTLGGDAVPGVGFGCTTMSEGGYGSGSGLVGLGRGPLSLVSQIGVGAFSYCLTRDASKASPLVLGSPALAGAGAQSTPLLPAATFYSVDLQSITIGALTTPGTGSGNNGIIFDSGTTLTFLAEPAYALAKAAVLAQTNLPAAPGRDGFEACFDASGGGGGGSGDEVPSMVLHFEGGADMALPAANYFVEVEDGVVCWVVQESPSLSIVGNVMQMNYHVRYDVDESLLSFQPANCDDDGL